MSSNVNETIKRVTELTLKINTKDYESEEELEEIENELETLEFDLRKEQERTVQNHNWMEDW